MSNGRLKGTILTLILLLTLPACTKPRELERIENHPEDFKVITAFMQKHRYAPVANLPPGQQALTNLSGNVDYKIFARRRGMGSRAVLIGITIRPNGSLDFAGNPTEIQAIANGLRHTLDKARGEREPRTTAPQMPPASTNASVPGDR